VTAVARITAQRDQSLGLTMNLFIANKKAIALPLMVSAIAKSDFCFYRSENYAA
jgi:hypothetical protein